MHLSRHRIAVGLLAGAIAALAIWAPLAGAALPANDNFAQHTFKVAAVDASGNVDPTPAVAHFSIPRPQRHRHAP